MQKAGTTALDAFLRQHPGIAMPRRKEVHFFDNESINWAAPDYGQYHSFFSAKPGQILGEATPIYSYWEPCCKRIVAYKADMKIILCLRDPVDRAYSHWEMEVSRRYERLKFGAAIRKGRQRVKSDEKSLNGCHRVFSYVERGLYAPQIRRLLNLFPREQILVLENAAMKKNLPVVLDSICDFVGVARFENYPQNKTILPTGKRQDLGSISEDDAKYLAALYREDTRETAALSGLDLSHWKSWL